MNIVATAELGEAGGDLLVLPVYEERVWGPGTADMVSALGDWVD